MTPAARTQSLIELIGELTDESATARMPADRLLQRYCRARRYIGSGDRRALITDFYGLLRSWELCKWRLDAVKADICARSVVLDNCLAEGRDAAELFTGERYAPEALSPPEQDVLARLKSAGGEPPARVRCNCPAWAEEGMRQRFGDDFEAELAALNARAPAVIRANTLKIDRAALAERLKEEGVDTRPTPISPEGLVIENDANIRACASYKEGLFEFQDEASQIAAQLLGARPGMQVCDYCAGTGGKTLALAAQMQNRGQIFACDVAEGRLKQLANRLQRAGVRNAQTALVDPIEGPPRSLPKQGFNLVIVDAPCSGTGSWRRQPDLRIRMRADGLVKLIDIQDRILDKAGQLVSPGGRLLFVTCSLLPVEGEERIDGFLSRNEGWWRDNPLEHLAGVNLPQLPVRRGLDGSSIVLTPETTGTDGFFISTLCRN